MSTDLPSMQQMQVKVMISTPDKKCKRRGQGTRAVGGARGRKERREGRKEGRGGGRGTVNGQCCLAAGPTTRSSPLPQPRVRKHPCHSRVYVSTPRRGAEAVRQDVIFQKRQAPVRRALGAHGHAWRGRAACVGVGARAVGARAGADARAAGPCRRTCRWGCSCNPLEAAERV